MLSVNQVQGQVSTPSNKLFWSVPEVEHPHHGRRGDEAAQPEGRHQAPGELRGGEGGGRAAAANQR